jgi:hypothetical protein
VADIIAMRLHDVVLCNCGAEVPQSNQHVLHRSSTQILCPSCRDAEAAETALITRHTLTELVADERGYALHHRLLPEHGTSVDHLFVGPSGVFVIDLVHVPDAEVAVTRTRGRFSPGSDVLTVGGSRATHLVDAVHAQCAEVAAALAAVGQGDVPVIPMLCFVDAQLPRRAKNRRFGNVRLASALNLFDEVGVEGPFDGDRRFALAMSLVSFLPSPA